MPERVTREMTEWLFLSSKEAHFNMIRVWGGGIYEPDLFYDVSDSIYIINVMKRKEELNLYELSFFS